MMQCALMYCSIYKRYKLARCCVNCAKLYYNVEILYSQSFFWSVYDIRTSSITIELNQHTVVKMCKENSDVVIRLSLGHKTWSRYWSWLIALFSLSLWYALMVPHGMMVSSDRMLLYTINSDSIHLSWDPQSWSWPISVLVSKLRSQL